MQTSLWGILRVNVKGGQVGLSDLKARILKSLFMPKSFKHHGLRVKIEGTKRLCYILILCMKLQVG